MKAAVPLAKGILVPLLITAAALTVDAGISKSKHGSETTTLIIQTKK